MNQSNKEYIELLIGSGVHTLLKETPNNFLETKDNTFHKKITKKDLHEINEIEELISLISIHENPLKKIAKKLLVYDGDLKSKLMIIGEAPGKAEGNQGKPFITRGDQLLGKMLAAIKIDRKKIYITNVIPWCIPEDRTTSDKEILEFLPFLQRQIEIIKPTFIFLLGSTAAKAILSTPLSLDKLRCKWHEYKSINMKTSSKVLVSYSPDFLLRSPNYKKEAWVDLQMLQKKINEN